MRSFIVSLLALTLPFGVAAQVYKYKDASGRIVYSDTPPPEAKAEKQRGFNVPAAGAPGASESLAEKEKAFRERREEAAEKAKQSKMEEERKALYARECEIARNRVRGIESGQRVVRFNDKGEREYLDDAQVAGELERARKQADEWCNPKPATPAPPAAPAKPQ